MKNDWPVRKLGEVADIIGGYAFKSSNLVNSQLSQEFLPVIKIGNFNNGSLNLDQLQYHKFRNELSRFLIRQKDILMAMTGATVGKVGISNSDRLLLNQRVGLIRAKENTALQDYLKFFLLSDSFYKYCQITAGGGAQRNISPTQIMNFALPLPSLSIQKIIVEKLNTIRKAQELNDLQISKTEELFESILESEITIASADLKELNFFTQLVTYGFTNPMPTAKEGPFMVTAKDIVDWEVSYQTCRKTTRLAYDTLITDKSRPKMDDILLTKDGALGRVALVTKIPLCINQSVALIRPDKTKIDPTFLKFLLESSKYQHEMLANAGGTTIKHIYISVVDKMKIAVPSLKEQKRIVEKLSKVRDYKKLLLRQKALLKELFDSVLDICMKGDLVN